MNITINTSCEDVTVSSQRHRIRFANLQSCSYGWCRCTVVRRVSSQEDVYGRTCPRQGKGDCSIRIKMLRPKSNCSGELQVDCLRWCPRAKRQQQDKEEKIHGVRER